MNKIATLTVIMTCFFTQTVFAATLMVPTDYPTIQAAVDAAATGDTVLVADGVYTGSGNYDITVSKAVTVRSQNGPGHTIIDCQDHGDGFYLDLAANHCPQLFPSPSSAMSLQEGVQYYSDREYTLTGVPAQYLGMQMIALPDDDRDRTDASDYLSIGAYCDLIVYVAYDSRAAALPGWMGGFSDTGQVLDTSLGSQPHLKIYGKTYADGECINLGANKAPGFDGAEVDTYVMFFTEENACPSINLEGLTIRNAIYAVLAEAPFDALFYDSKPFAVQNCNLTDNGSGLLAFEGDGVIQNSFFAGNSLGVGLEYSITDITDSIMRDNSVGIYVTDSGALVNRCLVSGNANEGIAGADSSIELFNSIVSSNGGGGFRFYMNMNADITNTTVYGNTGGFSIGWGAYVDITNSIFWENGTPEIETVDMDSAVSIRYSNLMGGVGGIIGSGTMIDLGGNIDSDPQFVDPDGSDDIPGTADDDLHLTSVSPCIGAGTTDLPGGSVFDFDIDLDPRIVGLVPDMGADEFNPLFTFFRDSDGDGYGDANVSIQAHTPPSGYVQNSTDCDDSDIDAHPGQTWYLDEDDDGYPEGSTDTDACVRPAGYKPEGELDALSIDCNDNDGMIHPGASEICNGTDDDCDGTADEDLSVLSYYRDADADGYGDSGSSVQSCIAPAGYVIDHADCNDAKASIHPGAVELCNSIDDNCSGQIDEQCIINTSPVASAGPDQTVAEGMTVDLAGTGSTDSDGGIASWQWIQTLGPKVALSDPSSPRLTFVAPPVDGKGAVLGFNLTVKDQFDQADNDAITVYVSDNGITGFGADVLSLQTATGKNIGLKFNGADCVELNVADAATIADDKDRPDNLIFGMIDVLLKPVAGGNSATMTVYVDAALANDQRVFKHSDAGGWIDYSDHCVFSPDRMQVTFTLVDGGNGDDDGTVDGWIRDPFAIGTLSAADDQGVSPTAGTPGEGGGSGGCFISSLIKSY